MEEEKVGGGREVEEIAGGRRKEEEVWKELGDGSLSNHFLF